MLGHQEVSELGLAEFGSQKSNACQLRPPPGFDRTPVIVADARRFKQRDRANGFRAGQSGCQGDGGAGRKPVQVISAPAAPSSRILDRRRLGVDVVELRRIQAPNTKSDHIHLTSCSNRVGESLRRRRRQTRLDRTRRDPQTAMRAAHQAIVIRQ